VVKSLLSSDIPRSRHLQRTGEPGDPASAAILVPKSVIRGNVNGFESKAHNVCREGGTCCSHRANVREGEVEGRIKTPPLQMPCFRLAVHPQFAVPHLIHVLTRLGADGQLIRRIYDTQIDILSESTNMNALN